MIIGFGYRAGCGKDTASDHLVKKYGFEKIAFAAPLKKVCAEVFSLSDKQLNGSLKEVIDECWGVSPRQILQKVGTECFRNNYGEDIWVKALERKVSSAPSKNWVVSDIRFYNEAECILRLGGSIYRIDRDSLGDESWRGHASERELQSYDKWDGVIQNFGSKSDLYKKIDALLES